ncbi:uncharacterized protein DEA37_0008807 [Paragonimus westermani]|uniref:Tensin n=1 Tax=Paragonimus westermani TaxID=34504 RepID=A0A5J4P2U9_9TREM|nr:uncharacterized protein DEA37_0008807 [Paragonimus westermani]
MISRQKFSVQKPRPVKQNVVSTRCCQLNSCCGCASRQQPTRRRKIKQISEPLRPDELNQILAQYGLMDEETMPSAWIGPYPSRTTSTGLTRPSFDSDSHPGHEIVSVPVIGPAQAGLYGTPTALHVPSSSQLPLTVQMPTRGTRWTSDRQPSDFEQSPLAYSLSAELASIGKHRFRLTYVTDRLLDRQMPYRGPSFDAKNVMEIASCVSEISFQLQNSFWKLYDLIVVEDKSDTQLIDRGTGVVVNAHSFRRIAQPGNLPFWSCTVLIHSEVVSYPPDSQEVDHNEGARWLCQAFERRYGSNYRIFNLSGFTKELHLSSQVPVVDLFWPVPLAPGLEQLVTAIDQLDYWLHNHDNGNGAIPYGQEPQMQTLSNNRVAVLHCTGPRSLLATYLAVYICQSKARFGPLCGQRPGSPTARGLRWNENRFRSNREQPTIVLPSAAVLTDLSQEQEEHLKLMEWYGVSSELDMAAIGKSDQNHQIEGSFPADQEHLSQLTRSIEQEIGSGRRIAGVGGNTFWQKSSDGTSAHSFMEGEGGLQLKIYQNLKLMHTTRLL